MSGNRTGDSSDLPKSRGVSRGLTPFKVYSPFKYIKFKHNVLIKADQRNMHIGLLV